MSIVTAEIVYPCSDGKPMADNMRQGQWMLMLFGNLDAILGCFVGMNNFWYPVEGEPGLRLAPDVYVAFGRPKDRKLDSYRQWEQADTPVTVVFEILSPSNTDEEMEGKYSFYEEYGVEEYYVYDPYRDQLAIFVRRGSVFRRVWQMEEFRSPRMGIRFDFSGPELIVLRPDGRRFLTMAEMHTEREKAELGWQQAEAGRQQAEAGRQEAEAGRQEAEEARQQAEAARDQAEARAIASESRAARLTELGRKARRGTASADELAELERLEETAG